MTKRTLLKLEIVEEWGEFADGTRYAVEPNYRMEYEDEDLDKVLAQLVRLTTSLAQWSNAPSGRLGYVTRVKPEEKA